MVPLIAARCSGVHLQKPKHEILNFHPDDQFSPNFHPDAAGRREWRHSHRPRFGGQIRGFHTEGYIDGKSDRRLDDCLRYCIVARKKALESADLGGERLDKLKAEEEGDGGGGRAAAKKQATTKDWESMSLSEKEVGLYVDEKGLLFWRLRLHLHRDWGMDSLLVCGSRFELVDECVKYVDEFEKTIYLTSNNHN